MANRRHVTLSIVLAGEEPPSEFRVFAAGKNETTKGTFVFDEASAKSVMAEYSAHGIDLALDYDHAMVGGLSLDPAQSGKAAGWFNLEVRDGELWAVNVRWTEPAAEALRRKEWRYMSPAFTADEKGRVTSLLNVAITNLPATRRLEPLMAASITALGANMLDPAQVKKALEAIKNGDADSAMALLEEMIASAAGGGEAPPEPVAEELADPPAAPIEEEEEKATAIAASISWLHRETGKTTLAASIDEVKTWKASHLKLEAETQKLAKERAAIELGKRKENAVTLTKLGAETPHTTGLAKGKLCKRLIDEPLDEQNERVAALLSARGGKLPEAPKPPGGDGGNVEEGGCEITTSHGKVTLSAREVAGCKEHGASLETYAANKAIRNKALGKKE